MSETERLTGWASDTEKMAETFVATPRLFTFPSVTLVSLIVSDASSFVMVPTPVASAMSAFADELLNTIKLVLR